MAFKTLRNQHKVASPSTVSPEHHPSSTGHIPPHYPVHHSLNIPGEQPPQVLSPKADWARNWGILLDQFKSSFLTPLIRRKLPLPCTPPKLGFYLQAAYYIYFYNSLPQLSTIMSICIETVSSSFFPHLLKCEALTPAKLLEFKKQGLWIWGIKNMN